MKLSSIAIRLHLTTLVAIATIGLLLASIAGTQFFHDAGGGPIEQRAAVDAATAIASAYAREEAAGHLTRADAQKAAIAAIGTIRHGANETVWVTDASPRMIADPAHPQLNGTDLTNTRDPSGKQIHVAMAAAARGGKAGSFPFTRVQPGTGEASPRQAYVQWFQPWGWVVAADTAAIDPPEESGGVPAYLLAIAVAGIVAIAGLTTWLARGMVRGTKSLITLARQLAEGDFSAETVSVGRRDEIGELAQAMELFRRRSLERFRVVRAAQEERLAKERRQAATDQVIKDFGVVISTLLLRLAHTAGKLPAAANEIASLTHDSRQATTRTAAEAAAASGMLAKAGLATVALANGIDRIGVHAAETTAAARIAATQAAEARARVHELAQAFAHAESGPGGLALEERDTDDGLRGVAARAAMALREIDSALATLDAAPEAIAALSLRHTATVRDFAAGVQAVARAGDRTAAALTDIENIADRTRLVNRTLLTDAGEVGRVATMLRDEAEQFFRVIGETGQSQRRFERVPGHGAIVTLAAPGAGSVEARLENISRGGASLRARFNGQAGEAVSLLLPQVRQPVAARIVRCAEETVAVAFSLDDKTMELVGKAIEGLA